MKTLLTRLIYLFTAPKQLDWLIAERRRCDEEIELENNRYRLDLCFKHRQEANHSHFSEQNCHHCQAEHHINFLYSQNKKLEKLLKEK